MSAVSTDRDPEDQCREWDFHFTEDPREPLELVTCEFEVLSLLLALPNHNLNASLWNGDTFL